MSADDLRARLIALGADGALGRPDIALAAAKMALTDYAERMDRAGQPAAAFGAVVLAAGLDRG